MTTLIGLATTVAWGYSVLVTLGLDAEVFFWEVATLIDIMLLGYWIAVASRPRVAPPRAVALLPVGRRLPAALLRNPPALR